MHCWIEDFSGSLSSVVSSIQKAWLCGLNINSWFYCWSISIKVKISSGPTFTCTFLLERKVFWSSCVFLVIFQLILNHRIFFSCKRVSSPRYITCVHVYLLEIWQEDSNGSSYCGAYLKLTGGVCCCLLVLWYLWYHFI